MDMQPRLNRRAILQSSAFGFGSIALSQMLAADGLSSPITGPHFSPRAKNVIFIFMSGGPSHLDLFDPKPKLNQLHGQAVPSSFLETLADPVIKGDARCFGSPRTFRRYGR